MIKIQRWCKQLCTAGVILFVSLILGGCADLLGPVPPTPYPTEYIPTVIALTVEAGLQVSITPTKVLPTVPTASSQPVTPTRPAGQTPTQTPRAGLSATASATRPPRTPLPTPTKTRRPSQTPTVTPTPGIPNAAIQISAPGPASKLVSPLQLNATLRTIPNGYLLIELWAEPLHTDEPARLLLSKLERFSGNPAPWTYLSEELAFEISRVSEFAQLRISTFDPFERMASMASVDLILLSVGEDEINPSGNLSEPIVIFEPTPNKLIQGGALLVSGMVVPSGDQILHFALVSSEKKNAGTEDVFLTPAPDGGHVPFSIMVNYQVSKPTWVRLVAYLLDPRIPGVRHQNSLEILLSP